MKEQLEWFQSTQKYSLPNKRPYISGQLDHMTQRFPRESVKRRGAIKTKVANATAKADICK